jgi:hypothetical protein
MLRLAGGLAAAWLLFVAWLDFHHALFPKTTIGGLKILAGGALVFFAIALAGTASARLFRRIGNAVRGSKRGAARDP